MAFGMDFTGKVCEVCGKPAKWVRGADPNGPQVFFCEEHMHADRNAIAEANGATGP